VGDGTDRADRVVAVPNPNPRVLAVHLQGAADGLDLKIFSTAYTLLARHELRSPLTQGWNQVPLGHPVLDGLPNGLYYVQAQPSRQGVPGIGGPICKLVLMR
jgi:hypothetical protein